MSRDKEGYIYYNHKRVSVDPRQGGRLLSVKTLRRNYDTREFLRLAGYKQAPDQELEREKQTVNPEQAESIKSKIESFKITDLDKVNPATEMTCNFIAEYNFTRCDRLLHGNYFPTYHNESLGHESYIDYFVVSKLMQYCHIRSLI